MPLLPRRVLPRFDRVRPLGVPLARVLHAATLIALIAPTASAIEGTELNGSIGVWAPLFPDLQVGSVTDSSDEIGSIVGLSAHHRFDGYRTSAEGNVQYGDAGNIRMFAYEALLRDTWEFAPGDLSAGFGYSRMTFDQGLAGSNLESDYQGAKIMTGWETMFGRRPLWLDLGIGLYDLNGTYTPTAGGIQEIGTFTSTYSVALKTDVCFSGLAMRPQVKLEYLSDIATFQNNQIGLDDGLILSAVLEIRLAGRR